MGKQRDDHGDCGRSGERGLLHLQSVLLITFGLISWSCFNEPLEPVAPTWDVSVTVPIANRSYTLSEIVSKDPTLLQAGVGNQIFYATSLHPQPTYVEDRLSLAFPDTSVEMRLGPFAIAPFSWSAPIEIPWLPRGYTVPIPDTTTDFADEEHTVSSFQSITFATGTATVTLTNNLPVPIDVPSPVSVLDAGGNLVMTLSFVPSTIPAGGYRSSSGDLAEKTLTSRMRVSGLRIHLFGSVTPVRIPATGDLISVGVSAGGLKARRAVLAQIPPQRLVDNNVKQVPLDDSTLVKELVFKSGSLNMQLTSGVDLDMAVRYRFQELFRWTGSGYVSYEDSVELPARSSQSRAINLAGLKAVSPGGALLSTLEVISTVVLRNGSSAPVTVSESDRVQFSLSKSSPAVVDTVVAVLKPTWITVDRVVPVRFGDLPTKFSGQVNVPSATLDFMVNSSIGFPLDFYLLKIGARRTATSDSAFLSLPNASRIYPASPTAVRFDPSEVGRFLSSFSGRLPDSLRISGRALVNPPDVYASKLAAVGSVGRRCAIDGTIDLGIPLMLGIVGGTYKDTIDIGDDNKESELDAVNYGKTFVEVQNGLPLQLTLTLSLLDGAKVVVLPLPPSGQPLNVGAAPVDAQGNVTVPVQSSVVFELGEPDIRQFKLADSLAAHVALQTTAGSSAVRFRTNDFVRLKVWSQLSYRVNRE